MSGMRRPASRVLLLVAALAGALVACRDETVTIEPVEATPGVNERFRSPASLQSYRYTLAIEVAAELLDLSEVPQELRSRFGDQPITVFIEGRRANPDREHSESTTNIGGVALERESILIGEELWTRQANGAWRQRGTLTSPEDLLGSDLLLSPAVIFGANDPETLQRLTDDLLARPHTFVEFRGREARYWQLDATWFEGYAQDFAEVLGEVERPERISIQLWTDVETGVGVRLIVEAGPIAAPMALRLEMELFDLNAPNLTVEEPRGAIGP